MFVGMRPPSPRSSIILLVSPRGKEYFVTMAEVPELALNVSGSHAFPQKWNGVCSTQAMWTESGGALVPQGELGCCHQQEGEQVLVGQAKNVPSCFMHWCYRERC